MSDTLYLVHVSGADARLPDSETVRCLSEGLYLVISPDTRSGLYHAVKRSLSPESLLVAPLADEPKFKGMTDGALKWLRSRR